MATSENIALGADEFAFHFETEHGVGAEALANFLKRAATVARRHGGELRVVGIHEGSLDVIIKAIKKSRIVQNAKKEFVSKPIDTTIKVSPFVVAIVWAIVKAMSPDGEEATPLAKAGAQVIMNSPVREISIITNDNRVTVMDSNVARSVVDAKRQRLVENSPKSLSTVSPVSIGQVEEIMKSARSGNLVGRIVLVEGNPYFRPDGYNFLVPVDSSQSYYAAGSVKEVGKFRIAGEIKTLNGQPDSLVVHTMTKIFGGTNLPVLR